MQGVTDDSARSYWDMPDYVYKAGEAKEDPTTLHFVNS